MSRIRTWIDGVTCVRKVKACVRTVMDGNSKAFPSFQDTISRFENMIKHPKGCWKPLCLWVSGWVGYKNFCKPPLCDLRAQIREVYSGEGPYVYFGRRPLTLCSRARWELKSIKNVPGQLYSYVKNNFKTGSFSSTFWFEHSFIAESAF